MKWLENLESHEIVRHLPIILELIDWMSEDEACVLDFLIQRKGMKAMYDMLYHKMNQ